MLSQISDIKYTFSLGGHTFSDVVELSPKHEEVVVFEIGLGKLVKSTFDFEKK
ncbi:MAG: hypothetical protein ACYS5F_15735 [Planctomycetota bacterium]